MFGCARRGHRQVAPAAAEAKLLRSPQQAAERAACGDWLSKADAEERDDLRRKVAELQRLAQEQADRAQADIKHAHQERAALEQELERKCAQLAEITSQLSEANADRTLLRSAKAEMQQRMEELSVRARAGLDDDRVYRGRSALDFYDAVFTIPRFADVYTPGKGWPVSVAQHRGFDLSSPRAGVRVVPLGDFNVGKTWLISQLSGAALPRGLAVHTEGVSVKQAAADRLPIILLDTVGSNSPMYSLPGEVDPAAASKGVESVLQELRTQEDFYRQLCFQIGQVLLLVIGQMSLKDQSELVRLARAIRKDRVRKDIVVVHNLRDWDMDMLTAAAGQDGLSYVGRIMKLFGLSDASLVVEVGTEKKTVIRHHGLFKGESDSRDVPVNVSHYYLTNDRLPCSCNKFVIQDMRATITRSAGADKSLAEELAAAATKIQSRFVSFDGREPEIKFDSTTSHFRSATEQAVRMKPRDLGSFFAVGSDDPAHSVTVVRCTATSATGRGTSRKFEKQERLAYHLQFELPGLCEASLADIRERFQRRGGAGALQREQLEGERNEQWTVAFEARLANIPGDHCTQIGESTAGEVELPADPSKHETLDLGSRPSFHDGTRTVKVMLRTGITDYDSNQEPLVSYADGVLGITLMKQVRG